MKLRQAKKEEKLTWFTGENEDMGCWGCWELDMNKLGKEKEDKVVKCFRLLGANSRMENFAWGFTGVGPESCNITMSRESNRPYDVSVYEDEPSVKIMIFQCILLSIFSLHCRFKRVEWKRIFWFLLPAGYCKEKSSLHGLYLQTVPDIVTKKASRNSYLQTVPA